MEKEQIIELLCRSALATYKFLLNHALQNQEAQKKFDKLRDIRIGDIVVEISSITRTKTYIDHVGRFMGKDPDGSDIIQRLYDDEKVKWSNCDFIKIPSDGNIIKPLE